MNHTRTNFISKKKVRISVSGEKTKKKWDDFIYFQSILFRISVSREDMMVEIGNAFTVREHRDWDLDP